MMRAVRAAFAAGMLALVAAPSVLAAGPWTGSGDGSLESYAPRSLAFYTSGGTVEIVLGGPTAPCEGTANPQWGDAYRLYDLDWESWTAVTDYFYRFEPLPGWFDYMDPVPAVGDGGTLELSAGVYMAYMNQNQYGGEYAPGCAPWSYSIAGDIEELPCRTAALMDNWYLPLDPGGECSEEQELLLASYAADASLIPDTTASDPDPDGWAAAMADAGAAGVGFAAGAAGVSGSVALAFLGLKYLRRMIGGL